MCGIFLVMSLDGHSIIRENVDSSIESILVRGPTHTVIRSLEDPCMISVNSILAISSSENSPPKELFYEADVFLYNGELYDSPDNYSSDTSFLIHNHGKNIFPLKCQTMWRESMYAAAWVDRRNNILHFTTDILGEKSLFYFKSKSLFILSSTVDAIQKYLKVVGLHPSLDINFLQTYFMTRHLLTIGQTAYNDISKAIPGVSYKLNWKTKLLDKTNKCPAAEIWDEVHRIESPPFGLKDLKGEIFRRFTSLNAAKTATVISGGIDSSLVSSYWVEWVKQQDQISSSCSYTLNFGGKDPSTMLSSAVARELGIDHVRIDVDTNLYAEHLERTIKSLHSPLPSHSYASQSILSEKVAKDGFSVLLGGEGGDEIYQGYTAYLDLNAREGYSDSPYSRVDEKLYGLDLQGGPPCGNNLTVQNYYKVLKASCKIITADDNRLISFILDASIQLSSNGLFCADHISSSYGIEGRSPLVSYGALTKHLASARNDLHALSISKKAVLRGALSSFPYQYVPKLLSMPKYGFSGYPNEAGRLLVSHNNIISALEFLCIPQSFYEENKHIRDFEWKVLNVALFLALR